jgi:AcrR family transcriptional regulator
MVPRNGEDARRRLQEAALELMLKRGYEATTAADIAAKAGVTERTFFRHFSDKREALFHGEESFRTALSDGVLAAPKRLSPLGALLFAFRSVEPTLEANRSFSGPRQKLIAQTPALQERVLTKTAGLIEALAQALCRRGVESSAAALAAQVGMAAFSHATRMWFHEPASGMAVHLDRAFAQLQALCYPAKTSEGFAAQP